MFTVIKVYRIEHKDSKLGPFQHGTNTDVQQKIFEQGMSYSNRIFKDVDDCSRVRAAYANKAITAFTDFKDITKVVRNSKICDQYHFVLKILTLEKSEAIIRSNQAIFFRDTILEEQTVSFKDYDEYVRNL